MIKRHSAILWSLFFLLVAPGTVAGFVPWWISRWRRQPPLMGFSALRLMGAGLIAVGVAVLLDSVARFALQGQGTPAPVLPTQHLIVSGLYRYVRNPMYLAVVSVILGQCLLFGNFPVFGYGAFVWLVFHVFVIGYEEPNLRHRFGTEYDSYCVHVPRWIPRLKPWRGGAL